MIKSVLTLFSLLICSSVFSQYVVSNASELQETIKEIENGEPAKNIILKAGVYAIDSTIVLSDKFDNIIIKGCHGAIIT